MSKYTKERRIRIASFCASGNKREFLTDQTGNRRWLPFEVESIEEQLLPVYFQPANPGDNGAVFMSAAEISSLLVSYGNIRKPLAINKLSTLLQKSGYEPRRTKTKRGYVVYMIKDLEEQRKLDARTAAKIDDAGDTSDTVF